jgi:hypothetical protein
MMFVIGRRWLMTPDSALRIPPIMGDKPLARFVSEHAQPIGEPVDADQRVESIS